MKTIREWLEELPEPYRSQALENAMKYNPTDIDKTPIYQTLTCALRESFIWGQTEQGYKYWSDIENTLNSPHGT